jgi:hypothetical protein
MPIPAGSGRYHSSSTSSPIASAVPSTVPREAKTATVGNSGSLVSGSGGGMKRFSTPDQYGSRGTAGSA